MTRKSAGRARRDRAGEGRAPEPFDREKAAARAAEAAARAAETAAILRPRPLAMVVRRIVSGRGR